ncbi:hypothetical protein A2215_02720 [Candidatus Berkelbacteria bacterium RIFOXYA2_FULL_43_10]|uniref:GIY-YIG domain-containing protein n=1 Tax=Candidatus Berkelbacteria bacterium RIFOXYA2_FULL_43_10 TaxID=1797472 RepID=A0A1F5EEB7_9BACT|nr:MAG: hypothetical protein A2215_02720 [Candidatus Berkelbacteria bacterium RIFOXYA2_FULL_43_10]
MIFVYILISLKDFTLYTGIASDVDKRLDYHNRGLNQSTKYKRPLKLIYFEAYTNKKDAYLRERFLKSGRGREVIKKQIANTIAGII